MRFRLPDLMAEHKPPVRTAYGLAKLSRGAISLTTAHRLVEADGKPARVDLKTLDAICDTLRVDPTELFERDAIPSATSPKKPARRKRASS